jgi:hypothetical protein
VILRLITFNDSPIIRVMVLKNEALSRIEQLCLSSIEAGIRKLCQVGAWPRPPTARRLHIGYDLYYDDIRAIPEAENLVQHLASDDAIKAIYFRDPSEPELHILYDYWVRLLLFVLQETEVLSPRKQAFRKWFRRFIDELYSDAAVWRTIDTVTGLTLHGAKLKFDGITSLTSIPGYELESIMGRYRNSLRNDRFFYHDWHAGGHDKATIVTTVTVPKRDYAGSHWPPPHLTQDIDRSLAVIDAVRLTKPGVPRLHYHAQFHLSYFPLADPISFCHREGEFGLYEEETVIDKSNFREIRELWQELLATKYAGHPLATSRPTPMDVALGRFSRTYGRQNWLDDMVDLTVALESLFGPKDNQELSHRISLRVAWLLGQDAVGNDPSWSSAEVYRWVRTMYKVRSARVHGGIPKQRDIRKWISILSGVQYDESKHGGVLYGRLLERATESAREIVRKAIRVCARLAKMDPMGPHWPLREDFDKLVVSSAERKKWQKAAGIRKKL